MYTVLQMHELIRSGGVLNTYQNFKVVMNTNISRFLLYRLPTVT